MAEFNLHAYLWGHLVLFGAALGSFLNVVIGRMPEELSVVSPGSRCPSCLTPIRAYDNIPIVSWFVLRGRCRHCGVRIAPRYLLLEVLTAVLLGALGIRFGLSWDLLKWSVLASMLLVIVFLDIDYWWIPDRIVFPGMAFAFLAAFLPDGLGIEAALLGLIPGALMYAVGWSFARITGKDGLGPGDVKLLVMLGLALGLMPTLTLLVLASLQGAVAGMLVAWMGGHRDRSTEIPPPVDAALEDDPDLNWEPPPRAIPFGPFLALAAFEIVLLPDVFFGGPQRFLFQMLGQPA